MESNFSMNIKDAMVMTSHVSEEEALRAQRRGERFLSDMRKIVRQERIPGGVRLFFDEEELQALDERYEVEQRLEEQAEKFDIVELLNEFETVINVKLDITIRSRVEDLERWSGLFQTIMYRRDEQSTEDNVAIEEYVAAA